MNFEDYLRLSVIPQIQISSTYFKPNIPMDKLTNAIQEYAPGVGVSSVVVLVDETFWGSAKEGMIITNEQIVLSKKLGGKIIDLASVSQLEITDKHLIINDSVVAKFNNPEVMPFASLGYALNDFVLYSASIEKYEDNPVALDRAMVDELSSFLTSFTKPQYFDSVPNENRKQGLKRNDFVLASALTEEQKQLIRFKGCFASNEHVICASWLETHGNKDYFFCVTNCGVHAISPMLSRHSVFIPYDKLRVIKPSEEFNDGRYIGVRFSNGEEILVSIENVYLKPYAFELLSGLTQIINGLSPAVMVEDVMYSHHASDTYINRSSCIVKHSSGCQSSEIFIAAYADLFGDIIDSGDEGDREFWCVLMSLFSDLLTFVVSDETKRRLWNAGHQNQEQEIVIYFLLITCLYANSMCSLPREFRDGMDDAWFMMLSLPLMLSEILEKKCAENDIEFNLDDDLVTIFMGITSDAARVNARNNEYLDKVVSNAGVEKLSEIAVIMLESLNIPSNVTLSLMKHADAMARSWYRKLVIEMISDSER